MGSLTDSLLSANDEFTEQQGPDLSVTNSLLESPDDTSDRLKMAYKGAQDTTAEHSARVLNLQLKTGLPRDLIDRNLDEVEKEAKFKEFDPRAFMEESPIAAKWMAENPDHASLAVDDVQALTDLERITRDGVSNVTDYAGAFAGGITGDVLGRTLTGLAELNDTAANYLERGIRSVGGDDLANFLTTNEIPWWMNPTQILRGPGEQAKALGDALKPEDSTFGTDVASAVGQLVGQVTLQVLTGGLTSATTLFAQGADIQAEQAGDAEGSGRDAAIVTGAGITALTERTGLDLILGRLPPKIKNDVLRQIADVSIAGGIEAAQEVVEGVLQNLTTAALINPNHPLFEGLAYEGGVAFSAGAIVRGFINTALPGRQDIADRGAEVSRDYVRYRKAQSDQGYLSDLSNSVSDLQMRERSPEKAREVIERMTAGGPVQNVYVRPEAWTTLFQDQNVDPAQAYEEVTGRSRTEYQEAVALDRDIEIPIADFAEKIAPTEMLEALNDDIKTDINGMTPREAAEFEESAPRLIEDIQASLGQIENDSSEVIYEDVFGQLLGAGMGRSEADIQAKLVQLGVRTMAREAGIDPLEAYERNALRIGREIPEVLRSVGNVDIGLDPLLDSLRAGNLSEIDNETARDRRNAMEQVSEVLERMGINLEEVTNDDVRGLLSGGRVLNQASVIESELDADAAPFREIEQNEESWNRDFPEGKIDTPLGEYRLGKNQYAKMIRNGRGKDIGLVKPTLENPTYIIDDGDGQLFIKEFIDESGKKYFQSVAVEIDNENVVISNGQRRQRQIIQKVESGRLIYKSTALEANLATSPDQSPLGEGLTGIIPDDSDTLNQRRNDSKRGQIRIGDPDSLGNRRLQIDLLEQADSSTFLHETGHYFLELMRDMVSQENASDRLKTDFDSLMGWLGSDDPDNLTTEQHEQFARGFEAYLFEGKAPSPELRSAFARFKAWLVGVYKTMLRLDVKLNDSVRGIMDRMLASDEEIAQAKHEMGLRPLFATAEDAGVTEAEFEALRSAMHKANLQESEKLTKKLMAELNRGKNETYKEQRKQLLVEVDGEVGDQPVYRVLAALQQKGGIKLARDELADIYGSEFLKRLPRPYIYAREGGVSVQAVAEMFGFSSADQMIKTIVDARPRKELVEALTDERMAELHPDLIGTAQIAEEAVVAVHNDRTGEVLRAELKILRQRMREARGIINAQARESANARREAFEKVPTLNQVREVVKRQVSGYRIRDLKPDLYRRAEAKAGKEAFAAAAKGEWEVAAQAKSRQLYNHEMFRQSKNAIDQAEKNRKRVQGFDANTKRETLGRAGADYLEQMDALLERYEFKRVSNKQLDRRMGLREWLKSKEAQVQPIERPSYAGDNTASELEDRVDSRGMSLESLQAEADAVNWRELSVEELQGVRDNADLIWHLAKLKDDLLKNAKFKKLSDAADAASESLKNNANRKVKKYIQSELKIPSIKRGASEYFSMSRRIPTFIREMDGGKSGVMYDLVVRPLNDAAALHTRMIQEHSQKFSDIYNRHYSKKEQGQMLGGFSNKGTYYESIDSTLTKDGVLAIALNWGNEKNRQRLLGGYGWQEYQVLDALATLDKRDWNFVMDVWQHIETYWEPFAANHKALYGLEPEKVKGSPFMIDTADGQRLQITGSYYPIKFDINQSSDHAERELESEGKRFDKATNRVMAGSAKRRVEGEVTIPVRLSVMGVVNSHVSDTAHHIAYDQPLLDVARVLNHSKVKSQIIESYGMEVFKRFNNLLRDIKFGTKPAENWFEKSLDYIRNGTSVAGMAFSVTTTLLQPLGLSNSISYMRDKGEGLHSGWYWMMKGFGRLGVTPGAMRRSARWVTERSDFMKFRPINVNREIADVRNRIRNKGWRTKLDAAGFWQIAQTQFWAVDLPTWYAAFEKATANGLDEAEAVGLADQAVRDAQGAGDLIDQVEFQRGNSYMRAFTNFMSYMAATYSQLAGKFRTTDFKSVNDVFGLVHDSMLLMIVPAAGSVMLDQLASMARGDDEDDEEHIAEQLAVETALMFMGPFVGIREAGGAIQGFSRYGGPAGVSTFGKVFEFGNQVAQAEADEAFYRSALKAAGPLFHIPSTQIDRTTRGVYSLANDETDDLGVILFGPPRN